MRNRNTMLSNVPNYKGAAVYALIDEDGKKYIGSTCNFKNRMLRWRVSMMKAVNAGCYVGNGPQSISEAVIAGHRFRAEIIEMLPPNISKSDLLLHEKNALDAAGGVENTYNSVRIYEDAVARWGKNGFYTQAQNKATQKYIAANLEEVRFRVKKGERQRVKDKAEGHGLSMAQYIIRTINTYEGEQVLTPTADADSGK